MSQDKLEAAHQQKKDRINDILESLSKEVEGEDLSVIAVVSTKHPVLRGVLCSTHTVRQAYALLDCLKETVDEVAKSGASVRPPAETWQAQGGDNN